jgi:hypothetical protein
MKHIAVIPMVIEAFLVSAALQIPLMLMQNIFHLVQNTRESTTLSYLIEGLYFSVRDGERGHFWDTGCRSTTQFEAKSKLGEDTE